MFKWLWPPPGGAPSLTFVALLGKRMRLAVTRLATPGAFLDGGERGEILLPGRYVPRGTLAGEAVEVFVHRDSEDRLVATTETPRVEVGNFAALKVVSTHPQLGAFLDWGLSKDLLLPRREQAQPVRAGDWVVAYVMVDLKTDRIIASTRLNRHLNVTPAAYQAGQPVELLVAGRTELGYHAIINRAHLGLLYHNELPGPLRLGQRLDAYVRLVRPDGKVDLSIHPSGYGRVAPLKEQLLEALAKNGGRLALSDASAPAAIRAAFGVSKKAFKQAVGALYRERAIVMEPGGIRRVSPPGT